ncbi:MAG: HAD family phosphatase [Marinilabiliales bacterium]|nr:HAD family phosphatase [Marinilabiliales bacterium]
MGGVIINLDTQKTASEMKKLGFEDFEKSYTLFNQTDIFDLLEKGLISPSQFRFEIQKQLPKSVSDKELDAAWSAMLLDFPAKRIELIQSLKNKYRTFLLSNTNKIHFDKYNADFISVYGFQLNDMLEKAYYSFEVGMRKPEADIYQFVLKQSHLIPEETLFIDDSEANIRTSQRIGY